MNYRSFLLLLVCGLFMNCAVKKHSDLSYNAPAVANTPAPQLDVFQKKNAAEPLPVLIFVYGGNWNSGRKGIYSYIGRNFARKGVVTVIPDYTKSPAANYDEMAQQVAQAIAWTRNNIANYGGDPERIYITGHSAGGHLAALAVIQPKYGVDEDIIKGIILNDAAGLDMYSYLQKEPPTTENNYLSTWTEDPEEWKAASPLYFLDASTPDLMIYVGTKTYDSIIKGNTAFAKAAQQYQPELEILYLDKRHAPMVTHLFWPWSSRYEEMLNFMKATAHE